MKNKKAGEAHTDLSWADIGFLIEGFAFAARPLQKATEDVTQEYALGPRGAWMVMLIARGGLFPLDLTRLFEVGRSLITVELNRLSEAGLITYTRHGSDGRRTELALTPLGEKVNRRLKSALGKLVKQQLRGYSREEIVLCASLLRDFRRANADVTSERYEQWSEDQRSALAAESRRAAPKKVAGPARGRSRA